MIEELFHIGSFSISPYGVMLVCAFLASYFQLRWGMRRLGIGDEEDASALVFAAGLGGIVGSVLDIVVLVACVESGMSVVLAAFLGATSGAVLCFLANKYWAFRDPRPLSFQQAATFGLVAVGTAILMASTMWIVSVKLGVPYLAAKAICAAMVFLVWSYPAQRRFVFVAA